MMIIPGTGFLDISDFNSMNLNDVRLLNHVYELTSIRYSSHIEVSLQVLREQVEKLNKSRVEVARVLLGR